MPHFLQKMLNLLHVYTNARSSQISKDGNSVHVGNLSLFTKYVAAETSRNSAYGKKAKTEKEWLVAQSSAICNSDRKKTGKDENSSKTVLAGGDYESE